MSETTEKQKDIPCGVKWCVALAEFPSTVCIVHAKHPKHVPSGYVPVQAAAAVVWQ